MKISDQLRHLADQLDGTVTGGGDYQRPGYVKVVPTGVRAGGIVRFYPAPEPSEGLFTYASRIQRMLDPDSGQTYVPSVLWGSAIFSPVMGGQGFPGNEAEQFDRIMHPRDWMTQADLDREANLEATGAKFSPG